MEGATAEEELRMRPRSGDADMTASRYDNGAARPGSGLTMLHWSGSTGTGSTGTGSNGTGPNGTGSSGPSSNGAGSTSPGSAGGTAAALVLG